MTGRRRDPPQGRRIEAPEYPTAVLGALELCQHAEEAVVALVLVVLTGDAGARAVWEGVV